MNTTDLFTKIGLLTVENDMLRAELAAARERIQQLEATQPAEIAQEPEEHSQGRGKS